MNLRDLERRDPRLIEYIVEWLMTRNGGELAEAFGNMRVRDLENLKEELLMIRTG